MKAAFIIYDGMTALDFVGAYDALTRLKTMKFIPDFGWEVCARTEEVLDGSGLWFTPTMTRGGLQGFDLVVVPGGYGARKLAGDVEFILWLRSSEGCKLKASVCTGSILLGAAGFLKGKRATTHRSAFDELRPFCGTVVDERVVDEGDIVTARGVTSSIDLGLHLCERLAGREARERIQRQMDYQSFT
ncbi:MAG TPA: DJ-1/PfpI family protein [Blastocatellia bacterium]|jgi:cyclohexyl-isocyanide hydratase|nr:DJ-1/PfpI family protein [Blastocatellia bacterium]